MMSVQKSSPIEDTKVLHAEHIKLTLWNEVSLYGIQSDLCGSNAASTAFLILPK